MGQGEGEQECTSSPAFNVSSHLFPFDLFSAIPPLCTLSMITDLSRWGGGGGQENRRVVCSPYMTVPTHFVCFVLIHCHSVLFHQQIPHNSGGGGVGVGQDRGGEQEGSKLTLYDSSHSFPLTVLFWYTSTRYCFTSNRSFTTASKFILLRTTDGTLLAPACK